MSRSSPTPSPTIGDHDRPPAGPPFVVLGDLGAEGCADGTCAVPAPTGGDDRDDRPVPTAGDPPSAVGAETT